MTVTEAAAKLGLPVRTVRRWCLTGKLTAHKEAGEWIIDFPADSEEDPAATLTAAAAIMTEEVAAQLRQMETRLAHIEGALGGQLAATLTAELATLTATMDALTDTMKEGLKRVQEESSAREKQILAELAELRKPWWKRGR